jgi:hypothetical protein
VRESFGELVATVQPVIEERAADAGRRGRAAARKAAKAAERAANKARAKAKERIDA